MKNSKLKDYLRLVLQSDLPGHKAHQLMMKHRSGIDQMLEKIADAKKSAVLLYVYPYKSEWYTVFIQRPKYDGVHSGQVSLPGGKVEPEDENNIETALREANEEVGILSDEVEVIGSLSQLYIPPSNFIVEPVVGFGDKRPNFILDPKEVERVHEIPLRIFLDSDHILEKTIYLENNKKVNVNVNAFVYNEALIWGATSMILKELAMVLEPINGQFE